VAEVTAAAYAEAIANNHNNKNGTNKNGETTSADR
jgi:hypothetical protein